MINIRRNKLSLSSLRTFCSRLLMTYIDENGDVFVNALSDNGLERAGFCATGSILIAFDLFIYLY
jgi:hypothetical protein